MGEITNLKKNLSISVLIVMVVFCLSAQAKYGGGTGEPNDPYLIFDANHMQAIGADSNDWDKHFRLMADIDLGGHTGTSFNIIGSFSGVFDGSDHTISNFTYESNDIDYIGLFGYVNAEIKDLELINPNIDAGTGSRVGSLVGRLSKGTISGCYVNGGSVSGNSHVGGLVGTVGFEAPPPHPFTHVTNCGAIVNVTGDGDCIGGLIGDHYRGTISDCYAAGNIVSSGNAVGGLAGLHSNGSISNSYATGTILGIHKVGGLVGDNFSGVTNCYSTGGVEGENSVGGMVGWNASIITECYSTGSVEGENDVGGLVGNNHYSGRIANCYSAGSVRGTISVAGLVGANGNSSSRTATVSNCYSTGSVVGVNDVGGLIGINEYGAVTSSFWDIETSGLNNMCGSQDSSASGCDNANGKTTAEMQTESTFTDAGWDFVGETANGTEDIWKMCEWQDYPKLSWQVCIKYGGGSGTAGDPYLIYNAIQMNAIGANSNDWDKHFMLMADIDLGGYTGTSFNIIGSYSPWIPFTGVFDGNGHTISNFTWSSSGRDYIGLFAVVANGGEITNLGLIDPNVDTGTGNFVVGSLVSDLGFGTVTGCYAKGGSVSGDVAVGGLVGNNYNSTIMKCYSTCSISGGNGVGGLVGSNYDSTIMKCYSTSSVSGNEFVGGLVGLNYGSERLATITTNCYSLGSVSGDVGVGGLVGSNDDSTIINCYSVGNVTGNGRVGGLVGDNRCWAHACSTITNSYWDIETSNKPNMCGYQDAGSTGCDPNYGKTTSQMMQTSTFAGWDFWTIWSICEGMTYPRFQWQSPLRDFLCLDGVDFIDYSLLASHWREDNCGASNNCTGTNLDRRGTVDINDLAIFVGNWLVEPPPRPARHPDPGDGARVVSRTADLSWTADRGATSHDVYFGTSSPPPFIHNQAATTFDPGTMAYSTVYYWRIDEVSAYGTFTGTVWSFTTTGAGPG